MNREFKHIGQEEIGQVVEAVFEIGANFDIWAFYGNLGSGKTTLIKKIANKLQLKDQVSSPTFNYVNIYDDKVYHFDCYRLEKVEEALNLGLEEYLDSGNLCLIEWPEVIEPLLGERYLRIEIRHNNDATRNYSLSIE